MVNPTAVLLALSAACFLPDAILAGRAGDDPPSCANPERTLTVDAVELVAGRTVPGNPDLSAKHEGIEYRFVSPANKSAFLASPSRYAVADGGACGRMGPLSGLGDARRYAVHDGRIYFFASEGCRASFLKDPSLCIEKDDPRPAGTSEQAMLGRAILDTAVNWAGGAERLAALATFRQTATRKETSGGKEYSVVNTVAVRFPDDCKERESWNESWFSTTRTPAGAAMASTRGAERIGASRARAFDRKLARHPLLILKAAVRASQGKGGSEFAVLADGEGDVSGTPVRFVRVWLNGAESRLAIGASTGAPLQLSYRGRDGGASIADVVWTFTEFQAADGVRIPTAHSSMHNGKPAPSTAPAVTRLELNPTFEGDEFALPDA